MDERQPIQPSKNIRTDTVAELPSHQPPYAYEHGRGVQVQNGVINDHRPSTSDSLTACIAGFALGLACSGLASCFCQGQAENYKDGEKFRLGLHLGELLGIVIVVGLVLVLVLYFVL